MSKLVLSRAVSTPWLFVAAVAAGCAASTPSPDTASNAAPSVVAPDEGPPPPRPSETEPPEAEPASDSADAGPAAQPLQEQPAPAAPATSARLSEGETRTMKVIQKVILDNRDRFRACYDKVQAKVPELQGDLTLYFVLSSEGEVREAQLNRKRSTITNEEVVECAIDEVKKLQFPPSSKGLETKVNYPFNFNPR